MNDLVKVGTVRNGVIEGFDPSTQANGTQVYIKKPTIYAITLSESEAVNLKALLSMCSIRSSGAGKEMHDIYNRLRQAGVGEHPDVDLNGKGIETGYGILGKNTNRGFIELTLPSL